MQELIQLKTDYHQFFFSISGGVDLCRTWTDNG